MPFLKLVTFSWKSQWERKESLLGREGRPTMEEAGQDPLDDVQEVMEIPKLEVTKQNLDSLNSDLEKDLQRRDEANQVLLKKIQEKEETIRSLERDIMLSVRQAREREELNHLISEREEALRDLELETAKLEKNKEILSRSVVEVQKEISKKSKNVGLDKEALKQMLAELKVKLQESTESCASQEEELVKIESDYQSVYQLCEDQAHYIKKYQQILRQMEKEKEMLLLEKEVCKAQNNSAQVVKRGSTLVETIQSNMAAGLRAFLPAVHKPRPPCGCPARGHEQRHLEEAEGCLTSLPHSRGGRSSTTLVWTDLGASHCTQVERRAWLWTPSGEWARKEVGALTQSFCFDI
ncbi:transmembrane and coiled-coil domain-containing protein 5B-like isoform X1 [Odocoileus virginianus]|uniref:Transmembrane and coiled-coil domain-containing protein 5B-like isoform X1 n=3 Tax=Odocoileus virginianus TaxID=9874 RepID=A0ABM4IB51_ODOVR